MCNQHRLNSSKKRPFLSIGKRDVFLLFFCFGQHKGQLRGDGALAVHPCRSLAYAHSAVLLLEALAQTGAVAALSLPENKGKLALFGGIKSARFRKQVTPGDVLTLHCELVQQHGAVGVGKASAWVDGKCAVTAELTFVLTEAAE